MSKVQGYILERLLLVLCFRHQCIHQITQIPLVLRLRLEHLGRHLDEIFLRVVAHADELDELRALRGREREIGGAELEDDFIRRRVRFAHVCRIAEA